ncbi:histone-like nucleoid-structuring protein Lsr2 [Actinomadura litoris]|uniref:Lsr2 family protein n=1 Tax=Actinomadura litoris TaxID=2678616 RepID=A0A7K1L906_9ACTN|nr:Lsr2 family protein [Actinomadura litoris]MUN40921.1 Lsr2 family protein [Actinomadura litoris]
MAQQVTVRMIDDLDGSEAEETLAFSLDGKAYEIDLSEENAGKLRSALQPFMQNGRRYRAARGGSQQQTASNRERSSEIREWAQSNGIKVNDRGRIPATVIEQYDASR